MGTKTIPNGNITSPKGFFAGAIFAGLKSPGKDKKDIGIIYSENLSRVVGTFTKNTIVSPSVTVSRERIEEHGEAQVPPPGRQRQHCPDERGRAHVVRGPW